VEFEPWAEGTIYDYMRFKEYVASLFQGPVDVIDRAALKPHLRGRRHAMLSMLSEKENGALRDILEIISAASRRLSDELKARHPDIPWREMAAAGNFYRHNYEDVTPRRVCKTLP
jgi:Protein of unknown function DUF86